MDDVASRLSDEKLAELEALCAKATKGPWQLEPVTALEKGCLCGSCREVVGWTFMYRAPLIDPQDDNAEHDNFPDCFKYDDAQFVLEARKYLGPLIYEA